jgi:shikimate kinase
MGTGKSSVGRALARRLRAPFTDLDAAVERAAGMSVAQLFARKGEAAFRRRELAALKKSARRGGGVVALGGGALLDPRARALAARTGTLVRLTCERRVLARRLKPTRATRPMLKGGNLQSRLAALLRSRKRAYAGAAFSVSTTRRSPAAAAALIARRLS